MKINICGQKTNIDRRFKKRIETLGKDHRLGTKKVLRVIVRVPRGSLRRVVQAGCIGFLILMWLMVSANNKPIIKVDQAEAIDLGSHETIPTADELNRDGISRENRSYGSKDIPANYDLFTKYFGDKSEEARKVAKCESGLNPLAHNLKSDDRGIMQINYKTWHKVFGDINYYDEEINIKTAKVIYDRSGNWSAWSSSYKCHGLK